MRNVSYRSLHATSVTSIPISLVQQLILILHIITYLSPLIPPTQPPPSTQTLKYLPPAPSQMSIHEALPFHEGEVNMHRTLRVPTRDNPTSPFLTPFASRVLQMSPLLSLGTIDSQGRPWTTLWGGAPAFARPIAPSIIAIKSAVGRTLDPVIETLLGDEANGDVVQGGEQGPLISALAIDLDARMRVKLSGRMIAGALMEPEKGSGAAEVQMVMKIETSLGESSAAMPFNCSGIVH